MALRTPANSQTLAPNATATTQPRLDNTSSVATDAFVNQQIISGTASVPILTTGGLYNQASLGTGLQVVIFASSGTVSSILSVVTGGTGYAVGDILVLNSGNDDAVVRITSVSGGVVQSGGVSVVYGGSGYTTGITATAIEIPAGQRAVQFSGALTSNVSFVIENGTRLNASRKPWFANNTTGAFTVTVYLSNGAGGTTGNGVVLPQGTNNSSGMLLYTDGITDVWPACNLPALHPIRTASTTGTVLQSDYVVLGNASSGNIVLTLQPAAANVSRVMGFKKIDGSANTVTVQGNASEKIDGSNTSVLSAQYAAILIESDGTQWWII